MSSPSYKTGFRDGISSVAVTKQLFRYPLWSLIQTKIDKIESLPGYVLPVWPEYKQGFIMGAKSMHRMWHKTIMRAMQDNACPFNVYVHYGKCT